MLFQMTSTLAPTTLTETQTEHSVEIETATQTLPAQTVTSTYYQAAQTVKETETISKGYTTTLT